MRATIGDHALGHRIDRLNRLAAEVDRGFGDVAVVELHGVGRLAPEHHIELRVPEHEGITLVDERYLDRVRNRFRKPRRQFQTTEARAENEYPFHAGEPRCDRAPTS